MEAQKVYRTVVRKSVVKRQHGRPRRKWDRIKMKFVVFTVVKMMMLTFNLVALTIPKWWTFKLLRWTQNLRQSTWDH
jgi:hypothetical protein